MTHTGEETDSLSKRISFRLFLITRFALSLSSQFRFLLLPPFPHHSFPDAQYARGST